ncbi:MAG: hypothetical protein JMDDDDMK_01941 [Acidobacteria bacterium]|nr:hypothetical protein [Acidobacteriota bacterium]
MAEATQQTMIRKVTPDEVMRRMNRGEPVFFIDSRNPQAWSHASEKLPGAIRIPADEVDLRLSEIPKDGGKDRWIVPY